MQNQYYYQWDLQNNDIKIGKTSHTSYPRHFHSHVEMQYALSGSFSVIVNTTRYELEKGDLLVIFPFQLHQKKDNYADHKALVVTASTATLEDYQSCLSNSLPMHPIIKSGEISEECHTVLRWLAQTEKTDEDVLRLRKSLINTVFWYFIQNVEMVEIDDCYKSIPQIVKYCENHFSDDKLSLDTISRDLGISKYYISRMFSQRLKTTFSTFINNLRIGYACQMLKKTDTPITQIALECGYGTIRHFNRIFQERVGVTPREFRSEKK